MRGKRDYFDVDILFVEFNRQYEDRTINKVSSLVQSVTRVHSAEDALKAVAQDSKERFDIILTDTYFGSENTFEMLQYIRKLRPHIPSIIMTPLAYNKLFSYISQIDVKNNYVKDPMDMKEFYHALKQSVRTIQEFRQEQKAENLLQQYKKTLQRVAQVVHFDKSGEIYEVNDLFCKVSGFDREELQGLSIEELLSQELNPGIFSNFWEQLENKKRWSKTVVFIGKASKLLYANVAVTALLDIDGRIQEYVLVAHDITDLVAKTNEARESEKAKEMFLANMSHEMRTPLNGIIGYSQLLQNLRLPEKAMEYVETIAGSGSQLLELINQILDLSKIQNSSMELENQWHGMGNKFALVKKMFELQARERDIRFLFFVDPNIPDLLFCDSLRIKQIMVNLISNALKFTKSRIEVQIAMLEKEDHRVRICFSVRDDGIGISEENQQKILKPFAQASYETAKKFGGTGLGLSIVTELLRLMDSKLRIKSAPEKGSEFMFTLELPYRGDTTIGKLSSHAKEEVSVREEVRFQASILVAEDSEISQDLIAEVLQQLGVTADIVSDGEEAVEHFITSSKAYDLVLMDLNMPGMDGKEAAKKIKVFEQKHNLQPTPVIALTANTLAADSNYFKQLGMQGYLSKPFKIEQLRELLELYLTPVRKQWEYNNDRFNTKEVAHNLGISEDKVGHYLQRYVQNVEEELPRMWEAFEEKNYPLLVEVAHRLKGTSGLLELDTLYEKFKELETKARERKDLDYGLILDAVSTQLATLQNKRLLQHQSRRQPAIFREEDLIQQTKMAAMGELLGNIAHQWRQPLNQLSVAKNLLVREYYGRNLSPEKVDDLEKKMDGALNYLSETIDDFRRFFSPNKKREFFSLEEMIQRACDTVKPALNDHDISCELSGREKFSVTLYGYPKEFVHAVVNIINNAKEAIINRGVENGAIEIQVDTKDTDVIVSIADNAGGIKPEIAEKILEPYFTTKFSSEGTGLGLYITKTIIENNMNGTLKVRNGKEGRFLSSL